MKQIDTILEQAEKQCHTHGVRLTERRKQVLSSLIHSDKALSAYELIDSCKERYDANIPAMSVYRILEFLETESLVHKLELANKYVACSHISCDHVHGVPQFLICSSCHKVKEITIKASTHSDLQKTVRKAGFRQISGQIEMKCVRPMFC